ncbi:MAG: hypothetical protein LBJ59_06630 [Zoogloeaceae bacterium]|nr:hypothetical protein [Zoogloeaceae bacterium]
MTYKQLHSALVEEGLLPESFKFSGMTYPSARQTTENKAKDPEGDALINLHHWHTLRKKLKGSGLDIVVTRY